MSVTMVTAQTGASGIMTNQRVAFATLTIKPVQ